MGITLGDLEGKEKLKIPMQADTAEQMELSRVRPENLRRGRENDIQKSCRAKATTDRFFNSLENEQVYGTRNATRDEAITDLFDCIEPFYNRRRRHSRLGGDSPAGLLENWISAQHAQELAA